MNPALTWYELLAIFGLATYLCAPAIRRLFDPELQRARKRVTGRRTVRREAREEKTQPGAAIYELGDETSRASGSTVPPDDLRIALTRSCADALLETLRGNIEGAPTNRGTIDPKLAEALRPGRRTVTIEVDDSPLLFEQESAEDGASSRKLFVVRAAAAGDVRVSSPWEYISDPQDGCGSTPATIWSAHSSFLPRRPSAAPTPILLATTNAIPESKKRGTSKRSARRA